MSKEQDVNQGSSPEEVKEETSEETQEETQEENQEESLDVSEDVKTPDSVPSKEAEEKKVPYDRFKKVNEELNRLKKQPKKIINQALDVEDYIEISSSLQGLDSREQEYLAKQHKFSGESIPELRESEDFKFWQSAYREKVEKEKAALAPSSTQMESEKPKSFIDKLNSTDSLKEQEDMLIKAGLYKPPKRNAHKRVSME